MERVEKFIGPCPAPPGATAGAPPNAEPQNLPETKHSSSGDGPTSKKPAQFWRSVLLGEPGFIQPGLYKKQFIVKSTSPSIKPNHKAAEHKATKTTGRAHKGH